VRTWTEEDKAQLTALITLVQGIASERDLLEWDVFAYDDGGVELRACLRVEGLDADAAAVSDTTLGIIHVNEDWALGTLSGMMLSDAEEQDPNVTTGAVMKLLLDAELRMRRFVRVLEGRAA
jgi:hypothetical protein